MNEVTKANNNKKFINYFLSSFIITTLIWGFLLVPKQEGSTEGSYDYLFTTTGGSENKEINTGGTNELTTNTNVVNKGTTTSNDGGDQQHKETNPGGTESVLNCDSIKLHNDTATEIAQYMCRINPDKDMLATFMQESGFNPWARGAAGEYGICQMMPNSTNIVWINDERWNTWQRQAERCIDKWKAVPKKGVIWMAYASRHKYLYLFN